jgi:hypothetical protein
MRSPVPAICTVQAAPSAGLPSTSGLQSLKPDLSASVDSVPATWRGSGGEGYKLASGNGVTALDNVIGADNRVGPGVIASSNESRDGRAGMNGVVSDTRTGVNAIAPSTDTPAGKTVLVNHLEGQLDRATARITKSEQRNIAMANMIRAARGGYGGRGIGGVPGMLSGLSGSERRGEGASRGRGRLAGGLGLPSRAAASAVVYAKSKLGAPMCRERKGPAPSTAQA